MDDMLTIAALYGPPDPQTRPNPYAAFQSVSGAQGPLLARRRGRRWPHPLPPAPASCVA